MVWEKMIQIYCQQGTLQCPFMNGSWRRRRCVQAKVYNSIAAIHWPTQILIVIAAVWKLILAIGQYREEDF